MNREWTKNEQGQADQSLEYRNLVDVVELVIRNNADAIITGGLGQVAERIVYRLVHDYDVGPFDAIRAELVGDYSGKDDATLQEIAKLERSR